MFQVLTTLMNLVSADNEPVLNLSAAPTMVSLTLRTDSFQLEVKNGLVKNQLSRWLDTKQARAVAAALVKWADEVDKEVPNG